MALAIVILLWVFLSVVLWVFLMCVDLVIVIGKVYYLKLLSYKYVEKYMFIVKFKQVYYLVVSIYCLYILWLDSLVNKPSPYKQQFTFQIHLE